MRLARQRAPIAQLDRASVYGTEGWRFKSSWVYQPRALPNASTRSASRSNGRMNSAPDSQVVHRLLAMQWALEEARAAELADEVPVGAVVLGPEGELLARAHNEIEGRRDPTAHAERLAITAACAACGTSRLPADSLLAVTLEPCAMCAGAIVLARPQWLVFGALDPKAGACGSLRDIVRDSRLNHRVELLPQLLAEDCGALLTRFFQARRPPLAKACPDEP